MSPRTARWVAALWGFTEATLFFIVPDVWLGAVALVARRAALGALAATIAGALAGGAVIYGVAASTAPGTSAALVDGVPTVTRDAIDRVAAEMRAEGPRSALNGPLRLGTPYKLYARAAGAQEESLASFLLWSIPARLARMLPVTLAALLLGWVLRDRIATRPRPVLAAYALAWAGFYAYYAWRVGI